MAKFNISGKLELAPNIDLAFKINNQSIIRKVWFESHVYRSNEVKIEIYEDLSGKLVVPLDKTVYSLSTDYSLSMVYSLSIDKSYKIYLNGLYRFTLNAIDINTFIHGAVEDKTPSLPLPLRQPFPTAATSTTATTSTKPKEEPKPFNSVPFFNQTPTFSPFNQTPTFSPFHPDDSAPFTGMLFGPGHPQFDQNTKVDVRIPPKARFDPIDPPFSSQF